MQGKVVALALSPGHHFSKQRVGQMRLIAGHGVEGDAHAGAKIKHRSRVAAVPGQPNLRQIHLIHAELLDELTSEGFDVAPGELGENITTSGLALLDMPAGTVLRIGKAAAVEITGLRNPCRQIEAFRPSLLARLAFRGAEGKICPPRGRDGCGQNGWRATSGRRDRGRLARGKCPASSAGLAQPPVEAHADHIDPGVLVPVKQPCLANVHPARLHCQPFIYAIANPEFGLEENAAA